MLVTGVVDDQVHDHADAATVCLLDEQGDILDGAVVGQHRPVVGDVVAAVPQRALLERQEPDAVNAEPLEVFELGDQPGEVADAVVVPVVEGAHRQFVEHCLLEPEVVLDEPGARAHRCGRTCSTCAGCEAGSSRT